MRALLGSVLAGLATGARSQSALAACALTPGTWRSNRLDRWLHRFKLPSQLAVSAVGEMVGDKLPQAPARTEPAPLAARAVFGALAAAALASRRGHPAYTAAAVGAGSAVIASYAGVAARADAAGRFGSDLPGALTEDALTLALAFGATRL